VDPIICPPGIALILCLSLPELGGSGVIDAQYPSWELRELHERYHHDRSLWSLEHRFGPVATGLVIGDTKYRRFADDHEGTLYLYAERGPFTFLVTPDSAGFSYRWEFGGPPER
jgi:hypothetical protein